MIGRDDSDNNLRYSPGIVMVSTRGTGPLEQQLLRGGRQLLFTQVESVQIEEVVVVRGRGWSTVQAINVLALQKNILNQISGNF